MPGLGNAMPPKSGFAEALAKVPLVVSLASRPNETTAKAGLVLPPLHPFESWGDYAARDGVIGLMQPTMGPVVIDGKPVEGKAAGDILLSVGRLALGTEAGKGPLKWASFQDYVKEQWQGLAREYGAGKAFPDFWEESLRRGGVWRAAPPAPASAKIDAGRVSVGPAKLEGDGTHALIVYPSSRFYDGRGADEPWLQEAPDTMTQITWDGWVEVPAESAARLGLSRGDMVKLTSPHGSIELPAWPSKTLHPGAVAVAMVAPCATVTPLASCCRSRRSPRAPSGRGRRCRRTPSCPSGSATPSRGAARPSRASAGRPGSARC